MCEWRVWKFVLCLVVYVGMYAVEQVLRGVVINGILIMGSDFELKL